MRRYLDVDLNAGVINTDSLQKICERILKDYDVNLKNIVTSKSRFMELSELREKVARKYKIERKIPDFKELVFLEADLEDWGEDIYKLQAKQGNIIRVGEKKERIGRTEDRKHTEEEILNLYEEISKPLETEEKKSVSLEECATQIEYMVAETGLFNVDCTLQFLMRKKYTKNANKKYRIFDGREKEEIDIRTRLKDEAYLPMRNCNELPIFTRTLQNIIFTQKYLRLFEFTVFGSEKDISKGSADITRYSYKYIEEIYAKIEKSPYENIYYFNVMLGVSLTNTIFDCIYNIVKVQGGEESTGIHYDMINEKLFDVATLLGRFECIYGRDILAKIIFRFIFPYESNELQCLTREKRDSIYQNIGDACDQICSYLQMRIDEINRYYDDLCDINTWLRIYDSKSEPSFDYKTLTEIEEDFEAWMKGRIKNGTVEEILGIKYEDNYRIKKMKMIKKPDNLYAQIHMAVMRGIWE
ncbi:MAG: hypothetical protein J6K48_10070 [Lachnospiraceae bacterium]|nr:hypothetical protein [Lachnospiraceae bacterium]